MKLALANSENSPASRLRDVVLVRVVPETLIAWIWCESLRKVTHQEQLYLFNLAPPVGPIAANLGQLNRDWSYSGLAAVQIPAPTFEKHLGDAIIALRGQPLPAGQSLRYLLDSALAGPVDVPTLVSVAECASKDPSALLSMTTLATHLNEVVVPEIPAEPGIDTEKGGSRKTSDDDKLRSIQRVSLWTPGATESQFVTFYAPLIGDNDATQLWALSRAAVAAVAEGQFQKQVELGDQLARLVPDKSVLAGEAAYFKAEGLRLLADLEPSGARKAELQAQAVEAYERASGLLPNDPRPLRGLGRIAELQEKYDGALKYFTLAKGICLTEMSRSSTISELDLAHEILRTTRHFIHCLLDIRATNPVSVWHRDHKERQLEGHLQECENFHRECMPKFAGEPEWYYIEWFMGFVFIAKAWAAVGNHSRMQMSLALALDARRRIMKAGDSLSAVERANLEWWLAVARGPGNVFNADFTKRLDRLDQALRNRQAPAIAAAIDDIVGPFVPPWGELTAGATPAIREGEK